MAGGSLIESFTMFMESQGPAWLTGPETWIQDVSRNTYTLPRITTGNKGMIDRVQGGDIIQDRIFLESDSAFKRYSQGSTHDAPMPQLGQNWTANWSFASNSISWNKMILGLNKNIHSKNYITQKFKDVRMEIHTNLWVTTCEAMDDEFWAQPNFNLMESTSPTGDRIPYSLHAFINEYANGLPIAAVDINGTAWTTVQTISSSTFPNWDNQRQTYIYDASTAILSAGIFAPMTRLFYETKFDRLPKNPEYSDKTTSPHVILTSLNGMANYEFALRSNQDEFRGIGQLSGQDASYTKPTFRGIPLDYITAMDTTLAYDDGSNGAANEEGANITGPRYMFLNGEYIKFVVHSENYCKLEPPIIPDGKPFDKAQFMDLWNNCVARSRRRQGHMSPSVSTTNA